MSGKERAKGPPSRVARSGRSYKYGDIRRNSSSHALRLSMQSKDVGLTRMLEMLKLHDHLCLIYESKEEWRAAVVPFISIGLKRGDKCIYVIDTSTADEIRKYLGEEGVDVALAEKSGQLSILHETEAYTRGGSFDPDKMIALLISETEKAIAGGYPSLRITGEMTWVLRGHPGSERLLEYEAKLNRDFFPKHSCLAICQYDRSKCDPEIIKGVIMTHPLLIRGNNIYHNFYYIPPKEFLSHKIAEVEVQRWLNNVEYEWRIRETLQENEERYRFLVELSPEAIFVASEGKHVFANSAGLKLLGASSPDQVIGKSIMDVIHPDYREVVAERMRKAMETGVKPPTLEEKFIRLDGTVIDVEVRGAPLVYQGKPAMQVVVSDITERKQAEEALHLSEQNFRDSIESSPLGIRVLDKEGGKTIYANRALLDIFGYSDIEEMNAVSREKRYTPESYDEHLKLLEKRARGEYTPLSYEVSIVRGDGQVRYVSMSRGELVWDGEKRFQIVYQDITDRRRVEHEKSIILATMSDLLAYQDLEHRVILANRAAGESVGLAPEDLVGRYCYEIWQQRSLPCVNCPVERAWETGKPQENEVGSPDGRLWLIRGYPITGPDGVVRGAIEVTQDITERKRIEGSLRLSEQNFRDSIENSPLGIRIVNEDGGTIYANRALLDIYGYSGLRELESIPSKQRYTPQSYAEYRERVRKRKLGEYIPPNYEVSIVRKDGQVRNLAVSRKEVLWNGERQFQMVYQDITERKAREAEYQTIIRTARDGFWQTDMQGRFLDVNEAYCNLIGYSRDELLNMKIMDIEAAEQFEETVKRIKKIGKVGHDRFETRHRRKDGGTVDVDVSVNYLPIDSGRMFVFIRDITERKRAEEALRESESRYRLIAENASDVIWTTDMNLKMNYISPSCISLDGYTPEEALNRSLEEGMTKESVDKMTKMLMEAFADEAAGRGVPGRTRTLEAEMIHKDGSIVWTETIATFMRDETGKAVGLLGVTRNIDARKRAEEALRASGARYRLLAENVRDVIWAMDMDLRFTYVSPSIKYLGDRAAQEVMSMSLEQLLTPSSYELVLKVFAEELALAKVMSPRPGRSRTLEVEFVRRDGSILWTELRMSFVRGSNGRPAGILGVMRDITERKKVEEERRVMEQKAQLASRLVSIGELAAGIAHEVNNPLTGVIGYAELLMQQDVPEGFKDGLEVIHDGAKRVAGIVRGLLTFARRTKPERTLVNINQVVETTLRLRAYELETSNIKVTTELARDLPISSADPGQLQQVFLNLIINAEAEMKLAHGKGELIIKTEQIDSAIRISFKDDGPGIAEENIERIFDPFFTTREIGKGTGLGLSVCHGIVTEHGGKIWAESEFGKGATFIVELPITSGMERPKRAKPIRKAEKAAKAKILVVDDELAVRQLLSQLLIEEGHEVETADDGNDALDMLRSKRYSLILLDIKLPGMSGIELYERVRGIAKSLANRVVFITGDIMGADTEAFLARTRAPYITKPFDIERLCSEVNRLLTKRHSTRGSSKS